jgi:voltage-gated potassium channel
MTSVTHRRSTLAELGRPALTGVLVIGLYYLVPVEPGVSGTQLVLRAVATFVAGLAVTWLIFRQLAHQLDNPDEAPLAGLLNALIGGVAFFALADYITALSGPAQFADLKTKTDALYFALATLTTVGYGDVHASGQIARGIVVVQLVFNVVVIATGASVLSRQFSDRVRKRRGNAS